MRVHEHALAPGPRASSVRGGKKNSTVCLPFSLFITLSDHEVPSANTETQNTPSAMILPSCSPQGGNSDILFSEMQGHWISYLQFSFQNVAPTKPQNVEQESCTDYRVP